MPEASTPAATDPAPAAAVAAPETKTAAPAKSETAPAKVESAKDPWAEFKPPEGFTVDEIKPVVEWAQKAGIDPKAAVAVALRDKESAAREEAEFKHLSEKGWLEELQKDPALGGEKTRETMVDVLRAADKLPPAIQSMIKDQGVLYNPIVVRVLHHFGTLLREDTFARPSTTPGGEKARSPFDDPLIDVFAPKAK